MQVVVTDIKNGMLKMKVVELIEELKKMPQDWNVYMKDGVYPEEYFILDVFENSKNQNVIISS